MWQAECKAEENKSHRKWENKQIWLGKYEQEFKNDEFIKPRENDGNDQGKRHPKIHFQQTRRSDKYKQRHQPMSQQVKPNHQNRRPRKTEIRQRPMTQQMQRNTRATQTRNKFCEINHGYFQLGHQENLKTAGNQRMPKLREILTH